MSTRKTKTRSKPRKANSSRSLVPGGVQRPLSAPLGGVVRFRQFAGETVITQTAAVATLNAFAFNLSTVTNVTGFSDIWDFYRVDYIEYTFLPSFNVQAFTAALAVLSPVLYTVIDLDDNAAPGSLAVLQEYSSCQSHTFEPFTLRFRPGVLNGVFDGAAIVAGFHVLSPWLDCARTTIPHYGMKTGISPGAAGQTLLQSWRVQTYVGLSFKNVR